MSDLRVCKVEHWFPPILRCIRSIRRRRRRNTASTRRSRRWAPASVATAIVMRCAQTTQTAAQITTSTIRSTTNPSGKRSPAQSQRKATDPKIRSSKRCVARLPDTDLCWFATWIPRWCGGIETVSYKCFHVRATEGLCEMWYWYGWDASHQNVALACWDPKSWQLLVICCTTCWCARMRTWLIGYIHGNIVLKKTVALFSWSVATTEREASGRESEQLTLTICAWYWESVCFLIHYLSLL